MHDGRMMGWTLVAVLTIASLSACRLHAVPPVSASGEALLNAGVITADPASGDKAKPGLATPSGLAPLLVKPRTGLLMRRASMPLEKAVAQYPLPTYLKEKDVLPRVARAIPRTALRRYAAARLAKKQGLRFRAIDELRAAAALAPDRPEIQRLLGTIYIEANNKVRAAMYFRKAVELDRTHLQSVYWLGRYELDQGQYPNAIAVLAYAMKQPTKGHDPALAVLIPHYLGEALQRQGHDTAGLEVFKSYLSKPPVSFAATQMQREVVPIERNRGITWMMIGDAYHRLNQPERALTAYRTAASLGFVGRKSLNNRLLYTHLLMKQVSEAEKVVVGHLANHGIDPTALQYVSYITSNGANADRLATVLKGHYKRLKKPSNLAIVIADLLKAPESWSFLRTHLEGSPKDARAYSHLMALCFEEGVGNGGVVAALKTAVQLVKREPKLADRWTRELFLHAGDAKRISDAYNNLPVGARKTPEARFVFGLALLEQRQFDKAVVPIELALAQQPDLRDRRLPLVERLLQQGSFDAARQLLDPVKGDDPKIVRLRVAILSAEGESDRAIAMLNEQIRKNPTSADLVITKARLQLEFGDEDTEAERRRREQAAIDTLEGAIKAMPKEEDLYEELFHVFDRLQDSVDGQRRGRELLAKRAMVEIPKARITRLRDALEKLRNSDILGALGTLKALVAEDKKDYESLGLYLAGMARANQIDEAARLIENRIKLDPGNVELLRVGAQHFAFVENWPRMRQLYEQQLLLTPVSHSRDLQLAHLYLQTRRPAAALKLLQATTKRSFI